MNPQMSVRGLAWDAKQQRRVLHRELQMVCSELVKSGGCGTSGQMGHRSHEPRDCSAVEDDGWKVDSGQTSSSSGPHSNPSAAVRVSTSPEGEDHQAKH